MKKSKLKRKSKNPIKIAKDEADAALQNAYRRNYPDAECESCGNRFYCIHHHILKSKSNNGRYAEINLIFICKYCHDLIHFGNLHIVAKYTAKRGKKWVEEITKLEKDKRSPYTLKELRAEKQKWDNLITKSKSKDLEEF